MKIAKIFLISALLLHFPESLAAPDDVPNMKNISLNIKKMSTQDISIKMTNTGEVSVYFYDSLFAGDDKKFPYFLKFRVCSNDLELCNKNDWFVPQRLLLSSTLIQFPAGLSKIDAGKSNVKVINISELIESSVNNKFQGVRYIQIVIEIKFDEYWKIVETYQSEWLSIE